MYEHMSSIYIYITFRYIIVTIYIPSMYYNVEYLIKNLDEKFGTINRDAISRDEITISASYRAIRGDL